jgi:hypothetical protein
MSKLLLPNIVASIDKKRENNLTNLRKSILFEKYSKVFLIDFTLFIYFSILYDL